MAIKKYREYTYSYTRHNPQIGVYEHTSTVIAFSRKNAEKLAKRACDRVIYGYNCFKEITAEGPVLTEGVDYRLCEKCYKKQMSGYIRTEWETVAEKIYRNFC